MKSIIQDNLRSGVSGMMRVKNDGQFIEACVESCISALDELIIVWNDCTDNSAEEIERMRQRYPDKIKTYEYTYKVYSTNLTKEEYEYAKSLPEDSPHLLCNYYNFCLSKVTCQYAVKIDADQIYFTEKMKVWCDVLRKKTVIPLSSKVVLGSLIELWRKVVKKTNNVTKRLWHLLPANFPEWICECYEEFAKYQASHNGKAVILSGINVTKYNDVWYVPMGHQHELINILPPFNGAGDHLFFKVNDGCYYRPFDCCIYNILLSNKYTLIEEFVCPYKNVIGGYFWKHLNMERPNVKAKINEVFSKHPDYFIPYKELQNKCYYDINSIIEPEMYEMETRTFSQFVFPFSIKDLLIYDKENL